MDRKDIERRILDVKRDLTKFERSIKNAPPNKKAEFKNWANKKRRELRAIEQSL